MEIKFVTFETMSTRKSFSLIPHDSMVLSSVSIFPDELNERDDMDD